MKVCVVSLCTKVGTESVQVDLFEASFEWPFRELCKLCMDDV